jgi:glycosyltransferase involved in cell wall biosynthesis
MESLSVGLPILCFDVTGVREVVVDGVNGFLYKKNQIEEIVTDIIYLRDNLNIMLGLSTAGLCVYREKFSMESYLENMERIYLEHLC